MKHKRTKYESRYVQETTELASQALDLYRKQLRGVRKVFEYWNDVAQGETKLKFNSYFTFTHAPAAPVSMVLEVPPTYKGFGDLPTGMMNWANVLGKDLLRAGWTRELAKAFPSRKQGTFINWISPDGKMQVSFGVRFATKFNSLFAQFYYKDENGNLANFPFKAASI